MTKLYQEIARSFAQYKKCASLAKSSGSLVSNASYWNNHANECEDRIAELVDKYLPSGAGFDSGTTFDMDLSSADKLVFLTSYHHMDKYMYYDGWSDHAVIVKPSLNHEIEVKVSGRDRNNIKSYIGEMFHEALLQEVEPAYVTNTLDNSTTVVVA